MGEDLEKSDDLEKDRAIKGSIEKYVRFLNRNESN
jgi:hypothetical protein